MIFQEMLKTEVVSLHGVEAMLAETLRELEDFAEDWGLKQALGAHRIETEIHATRLRKICSRMAWTTDGRASTILEAMRQEAEENLGHAPGGPIRDAMIIAAAQKTAHLEIACYGTARALAYRTGATEAGRLLSLTLEEEKRFDSLLTEIAESGVNQAAAQLVEPKEPEPEPPAPHVPPGYGKANSFHKPGEL